MAGRPRSIKSAAELSQRIDEYIAQNIQDNLHSVVVPSDYSLCKFLGITSQTLWEYRTNKETYKGYSEALKKLVDYREQFLLDLGVNNPKAASMAIFALKQPKNGGYEDRPTVNVEAKELKIVTGEGMPKGSFE